MSDTTQATALKSVLKTLIVQACDKDCEPGAIADDEILFGTDAKLALDSLDALQLSMALQKKFGVRLTDSKETRRILSSVDHLAAWLTAQGKTA
ncbi:MAG: phosphopantetheine-binding protein [Candidatus Accumulibacter sp.]|jgi:acyl carrier protein|nr:phosphopantetheine-binding protein [Accumulibacter sp.]